MYISKIVLPDGTQISSGVHGENALESVSVTGCVNETKELTLGSVCSEMLEATILIGQQGLSIQAGTELILYRMNYSGEWEKQGVFVAEKPTKLSANKLKLTAYDRVSLLDKDLTLWLKRLDRWPYTLEQFIQQVADACQVQIDCSDILNRDAPVYEFTAGAVTGRQLLRWAGQVAGRFCSADRNGSLLYRWYYDRGGYIEPTGACFYYQGSLRYEDYQVEPVEMVCIKQGQNDVGTVYPEGEQVCNLYTIVGNPILTGMDSQSRTAVAQTLYELLSRVSYRPCKAQVSANLGVKAGDIITVTDSEGNQFSSYIMNVKHQAHRDTLESTGSARRDQAAAVSQMHCDSLSGRVMNLEITTDGIKAENKDAAGAFAALELTVDRIQTTVSDQQETIDSTVQNVSAIDQTAYELRLDVEAVHQELDSTVQNVSVIDQTAYELRLDVKAVQQELDSTVQNVSVIDQTAYELRLDVEAVQQELDSTTHRTAQLELSAQGILSRVECQTENTQGLRQELTRIEQSTTEIGITVKSIQEEGVDQVVTATGFCFDAQGLRIQKEGQQMENLLTDEGMFVSRGDTVLLQADQDGVQATDVSVKNYLIVGEHCRFEDHTDSDGNSRTACFWVN